MKYNNKLIGYLTLLDIFNEYVLSAELLRRFSSASDKGCLIIEIKGGVKQ